MNLADVEQIIADHKPLPEPFNGATRLILSRELFDAIAPHMGHAFAPHTGPAIEVLPHLPPGYGVGYRPWRDGDDPDLQHVPAETMVWFCGPKTTETVR